MIEKSSFTYTRVYPVKCAQCGKMLYSKADAEEHQVEESSTQYMGGRKIVSTSSKYTVPMCKECHKRVSKIESRGCLCSLVIILALLALTVYLGFYADDYKMAIATFVGMWIYIAFANNIINRFISNDKKEHTIDDSNVGSKEK